MLLSICVVYLCFVSHLLIGPGFKLFLTFVSSVSAGGDGMGYNMFDDSVYLHIVATIR